jgi:hypothetical protein
MPGNGDNKSVAKPESGNRDKVGEQTKMPGKETKGSAKSEDEHRGKSSGAQRRGTSWQIRRERAGRG